MAQKWSKNGPKMAFFLLPIIVNFMLAENGTFFDPFFDPKKGLFLDYKCKKSALFDPFWGSPF